jgi:DNA-binding phage protein
MTKLNKRTKYNSFHDDLVLKLRNDDNYFNEFLKITLEDYKLDGNLSDFLFIIKTLAEVKGGLGKVAKETDITRQTVYNALKEGSNPTINTIDDILRSLGFCLSIQVLNENKKL